MKRAAIFLFVAVITIFSSGSALAYGGSARIRVVHAVPDAAGVYVSVDNNIVLGHVYYGDISAYVPVMAGTNNVKVVTANQAQTVLVDTSFIMEQDASYTIVVSGVPGNIAWLRLDDNSPAPEYGTANLQFVQTSPDTPLVDVAIVDCEVLFEDVPFNQQTGYKPVNGGAYDLEVRVANTEEVLLEIPWVPTYSGTASTVFMMGLKNSEPGLDASFSTDGQFRMSYPSNCCHYSRPQYYPQIRYIRPGPNYYYFRGNTPGWPGWGW